MKKLINLDYTIGTDSNVNNQFTSFEDDFFTPVRNSFFIYRIKKIPFDIIRMSDSTITYEVLDFNYQGFNTKIKGRSLFSDIEVNIIHTHNLEHYFTQRKNCEFIFQTTKSTVSETYNTIINDIDVDIDANVITLKLSVNLIY